jgi:tRNA (cmo5U34)-methyltransferase
VSDSGIGLPGNAEDMATFFDLRALGYEQHMRVNLEDHEAFYQGVVDALRDVHGSPEVLDLGVGTGLELDRLFRRFPHARVTGVDVSSGMLEQLAHKPRPRTSRLDLIHASFLDMDLGSGAYDAVISSMALHHWMPFVRLGLYRRIHEALRVGGWFVNGDYVESELESNRRLEAFATRVVGADHGLHIDLPLTVDHEIRLLGEAGFAEVRVALRQTRACVLVGRRLPSQAAEPA